MPCAETKLGAVHVTESSVVSVWGHFPGGRVLPWTVTALSSGPLSICGKGWTPKSAREKKSRHRKRRLMVP